MDLKYILKIFIIVFIILSLIIFINSVGLNLNEQTNKKLLQVVTIEGLTNTPDTSIIINKNDAFCESYRGSGGALDDACGKLTRNNCNSTSCCVWTSENKCTAGRQGGPIFNSDAKGKTKNLDYYFFENKCYGPKCPN
jgi:hypothetical protein